MAEEGELPPPPPPPPPPFLETPLTCPPACYPDASVTDAYCFVWNALFRFNSGMGMGNMGMGGGNMMGGMGGGNMMGGMDNMMMGGGGG